MEISKLRPPVALDANTDGFPAPPVAQTEDELDKKEDAIDTKNAKATYNDRIEDEMIEMAKLINKNAKSEMEIRKNLIEYLKKILLISICLPLIVVAVLIVCEFITEGVEILVALVSAMITVPTSIIGVFHAISSKLFADTYKTSLPDLLGKYKDFK